MKNLKLNCYFNDYDWVIAYDEEDAWNIWCESTGEKRENYEEEDGFWAAEPLNKKLNFYDENMPDNRYRIRTQTTKKWIKELGRGFMMTTEH